jgi:hypothetical protein
MSDRVFKELFHPILFVVRHRRLLPRKSLIRLVAVRIKGVGGEVLSLAPIFPDCWY